MIPHGLGRWSLGRSGHEPTRGTASAIDAFLDTARSVAPPQARARRGRLIFALDATMSRQPTWTLAQSLQRDMFEAAASMGGLDIQIAYFRGHGECRASSFVSGADTLHALMVRIACAGGHTQIGRILRHAREETRKLPVDVLVYVGDAMEEKVDDLCETAGELGLLGVKTFVFQEGRDRRAERAFREIARLTNGAFATFDRHSADHLAALLRAAAAYAANGREGMQIALRDNPATARNLLSQMR